MQGPEVGNSDFHGTGDAVEDEDELGAPACRVDALPASTEVRRVASTEARLKRIPPQWAPPPAGSDSLTRSDFLSNEKSQLDVDHFGVRQR
jgi:hypothetical protein